MREVNGIKLYWQDESDLPSMCGLCPWYMDGSTSAPVIGRVYEKGMCTLRGNMTKSRWADVPQACRRFFERILKAPDGTKYVIVLRDENR